MAGVSVTFRKSIFIAGTPYVAGSTYSIDEALISQFPRDTIVPAVEPDPKNDSRTVDEKIADALEDFDGGITSVAAADITMPAAEPVSGGDFVTLTTDGVVRASASDLDRPAHGFVKTAASAGQTCSIYRKGRITGLSGLARGTTYYLSSINAGKPTPTPAGAFSQQVGVGAADDTLLVAIEPPILTP